MLVFLETLPAFFGANATQCIETFGSILILRLLTYTLKDLVALHRVFPLKIAIATKEDTSLPSLLRPSLWAG